MEQHVIEVTPKQATGKGVARKLRAKGLIPGVVYGHKEPPRALSVDPHVLTLELQRSGKGRNTLFTLKGLDRDGLTVLIKDRQVDPVRRSWVHVDFIEVREGDRVDVGVPFVVQGRAAGVVLGGELHVIRRGIPVTAGPLAIPSRFEIDVSALQIGDNFTVSQVQFPDGVTPRLPDNAPLVTVRASRASAGAGPAEGAEGEEGADAAAAAEKKA